MRNEQEIREELERVEDSLREAHSQVVISRLNARLWALKWVLQEEE